MAQIALEITAVLNQGNAYNVRNEHYHVASRNFMPAKPVSKRSEAYGKHLPTLDNDPWKVLYCAFADTSLAVTVLMFGAVV
ncbi:hypothetical protein RB195_002807 [Necator americanus]|uniref:Uncharacterized protein n=1 Tax=Necator americanus TaxID=51031 RepID=A0ABR1DKR0_NECAM